MIRQLQKLFPTSNETWTILGFSLGIRVLYGMAYAPFLFQGDPGYYFQDAISIFQGLDYEYYWPPGLSHLLALGFAILGQSKAAAIAVMMSMYVLFFFVVIWVLRPLTNRKTINWILLFFGIYPAFIHHSVAPLTHLPVAVCLLVLAKLMIMNRPVRFSKPNRSFIFQSIIMGIVAAIALLFRPGVLTIFPVILAGFFLIKNQNYSHAISQSVVFLFSVCLIVLPWIFHLHSQTNRWIWINDANTQNVYIGNNPWTPSYHTWWLGSHDEQNNPRFQEYYAERDSILDARTPEIFSQKALDFIKQEPGSFLLRTVNRIRVFFAFDTYAAGVWKKHQFSWSMVLLLLDAICWVFLGIMAIIGLSMRNWGCISWWYMLLAIAYGIPYFLAFSHPSYHLPIAPVLILMALLAMKNLKDIFTHIRSSKIAIIALICFFYIQLEWAWFLLHPPIK